MKEPEITLFGRKIVLPENAGESSALSSDEGNSGSSAADYDNCLEGSGEEENGEKANEEKQLQNEEEKSALHSEPKPEQKDQENPVPPAVEPQNPKTPSITEDLKSENNPKTENDQSDATNGQQKTLKKPDKILPCPRCNSMDTKFCYYNNYNINQPRHFCKSCQRYWTAGGSMRNVPVGAGRRKNKNAASHCCHITISEALHAFKPNGTVLSFGANPQLCKPVAEKRAPHGVRNGYHNSCMNGENVGDSNSIGLENGPKKPVIQNINGFPSPVPLVPFPFPWNPAVPVYPMPFYPAPYWNIPWISCPNTEMGPCPNSYLGKHSRSGELIRPNSEENRENSEVNDSESSIVVPKTLRIDDPEEAGKSSIWETLGIKYGSISREGLFKALQPKVDGKKAMVSASSFLQANPAALSRSISFRERA